MNTVSKLLRLTARSLICARMRQARAQLRAYNNGTGQWLID
ncbi:hypothetical protein [Telmatospirillum sp. J64-1]|nr:hypothetical protein [Telmatospirillum sp. J64-1]